MGKQLPEKIRRVQELRRSGAAGPHKTKRRDEYVPDFDDFVEDDGTYFFADIWPEFSDPNTVSDEHN